MDKFAEIFARYKWRILLTAGGLLLAVLWLTLGFWRTLLLLILGMAGFMLGYKLDEEPGFRAFLNKIIPERFRKPDE